jgi:hypothetical protein
MSDMAIYRQRREKFRAAVHLVFPLFIQKRQELLMAYIKS